MGNKLIIYFGAFVVLLVIVAAIFVGIKFVSKDSPEKVVEKMFESYLNLEFEGSDYYVDYSDEELEEIEEFEELYGELYEEVDEYIAEEIMEYEDIKEVSNNGKTAKVSVKVTAIDFLEVFETFLEIRDSNPDVYNYSAEEFDDYYHQQIVKIILDGDVDTVTNKVTLTLKKNKEDEWKIKDNDEFAEVLLGNYKKVKELYE